MPERFVAVSLLTRQDLDRWGPSLRNVYPLDSADDFADILRRIDAVAPGDAEKPDAPPA